MCYGETLDVVMENGENLLGGQNLLSTTVGEPEHVSWSSPPPTDADTYMDPTTGMDNTINTEPNQVLVLFECLRDCRRASEGIDLACLLTSCHVHSCRKYF